MRWSSIRNLEGSEGLALRRRVGMALVVVEQMLLEGAIMGGSALALRCHAVRFDWVCFSAISSSSRRARRTSVRPARDCLHAANMSLAAIRRATRHTSACVSFWGPT